MLFWDSGQWTEVSFRPKERFVVTIKIKQTTKQEISISILTFNKVNKQKQIEITISSDEKKSYFTFRKTIHDS